MEVRAEGSRRKRSGGSGRGSSVALRGLRAGGSATDWIGEALGQWQAQELRLARRFGECRGLNREQLEDVYQNTSIALLARSYRSEEHLRHALRMGIRQRALNVHRDERRRREILAESAPGIYAVAEAGAGEQAPELAAIVRQDRMIVSEFLTELSPIEQRVFWLMAEGMQYRAIAPALGLAVNAARNASRAVERKRERFQLLYDTGRLCGFRSATILALQNGQATTEELAERAFAHLDGCAHCRAEHKTNAQRLRRRFQGQAAALLPMPALSGHLSWLVRVDARLRSWLERLLPGGAPPGSGGARERAIALLAGSGATAKVAVRVTTAVVVAGGATAGVVIHEGEQVGASRGTHHRLVPRRVRAAPSAPVPAPIIRASAASLSDSSTADAGGKASNGGSESAGPVSGSKPHEPGGFAYLGVTRSTPRVSKATMTAHVASQSGGGQASPQSGGGQFSP